MLNKKALIDSLSTFIDADNELFQSYPQTQLDSAKMFSCALFNYTKDITPKSISHKSARKAFEETFNKMSIDAQNGAVILTEALNVFFNELGKGMIRLNSVVSYTAPLFTKETFIHVWSVGLSGNSSKKCIKLFSDTLELEVLKGFSTTKKGVVLPWL